MAANICKIESLDFTSDVGSLVLPCVFSAYLRLRNLILRWLISGVFPLVGARGGRYNSWWNIRVSEMFSFTVLFRYNSFPIATLQAKHSSALEIRDFCSFRRSFDIIQFDSLIWRQDIIGYRTRSINKRNRSA